MKYMMSEELVLGVLQQDLHDQNMSGCEALGLDPASLLLYGKSSAFRRQSCDHERVNQMDRWLTLISMKWCSTLCEGHPDPALHEQTEQLEKKVTEKKEKTYKDEGFLVVVRPHLTP